MTQPTNGNARRQPGADTSNNYVNDTANAGIKQSAKRLIVGAAVWGYPGELCNRAAAAARLGFGIGGDHG